MLQKVALVTLVFLAGLASHLDAKPLFHILYSGQMQGELRPFVV